MPTTFNGVASPANSAQLGIKEFFNDPLLTALIDQGLAGNRELKVLEEEVQVAASVILQRRGAYLPFVGFRALAEDTRYSTFTLEGASLHDDAYLPGKFFPNPLPNYMLGLPFFWQIDIWRELRNSRDAAVLRYQAAVEKRNYFVTRLVADIADNYYGLMALDKRMENLNQIIELQENSLQLAKARMDAGRSTQVPVQRFQADIRKNQSNKLIVRQDIIETENRINFLLNRYPQPVERMTARYYELSFPLSVGVPAQLLQYRPDIRQAERELEAAGIDIKVARAHFFPKLDISGNVGYEAFNPKYLFWTPAALVTNIAGDLVVPVINKAAIKAEFLSANAKQLEALYEYQRVILNAFTEVVNRMSMVENYSRSFAIKQQQLQALESAVEASKNLYLNARIEYLEVITVQRDLQEARFELIDAKRSQLTGFVTTYQALGGGALLAMPPHPAPPPGPPPGHGVPSGLPTQFGPWVGNPGP